MLQVLLSFSWHYITHKAKSMICCHAFDYCFQSMSSLVILFIYRLDDCLYLNMFLFIRVVSKREFNILFLIYYQEVLTFIPNKNYYVIHW